MPEHDYQQRDDELPAEQVVNSYPDKRYIMSHEDMGVDLQPIIHQVGGNSSMLQYDETTVCKKLLPHEHNFYTHITSELRQFTPNYKGIIDVQWIQDKHGHIKLLGCPLTAKEDTWEWPTECESTDDKLTSRETILWENNNSTTRYSARLLRGVIEVRTTGKGGNFETKDPTSPTIEGDVYNVNPWTLRCYGKQLTCMRKNAHDRFKFILLENVVSRYKHPCILDLKMGTRQYNEDTSEAKKQNYKLKCPGSTSAKLGTRLGGMQAYQVDAGKYICHNKFHGWSLTCDQFKEVLKQFIHNGHRLRTELLKSIIHKLQNLKEIIQNHNAYRFYACSVLLLYEGKDYRDTDTCRHPNSSGKSNIAQQWKSHENNIRFIDGPCDNDSEIEFESENGNVDVRIIDFEHVTRAGMQRDQDSGPDAGCLLGLANLIDIFKEIQQSSD